MFLLKSKNLNKYESKNGNFFSKMRHFISSNNAKICFLKKLEVFEILSVYYKNNQTVYMIMVLPKYII